MAKAPSAPMTLPLAKPSDYYVPASDKDGQSVVVRLRINRKYLAAIRLLVQKYRDVHGWVFDTDFLRWAVHRALEEMNRRIGSGALNANVAALRLMTAAAQARQEHQNFMSAVDLAVQEVEYLNTQGDYGAARTLIAELQQRVRDDPNAFWRHKWAKLLQSRFGHMLDKNALKQVQEDIDGETDD